MGVLCYDEYMRNKLKRVALVDADLLANGTRHPNLVLLKLAGYFRDNNISYSLITDGKADVNNFDRVYLSKVFTFTPPPQFFVELKENNPVLFEQKIRFGGTGWYATEENLEIFLAKRNKDFYQLDKDPDLPGLNMKTQMPDYNLYKDYVNEQIENGRSRVYYKDYLDYSIGFLTRGCFRQCPFCVNKLETKVYKYSELEDFVDPAKPYIYLWDDNFFASSRNIWKSGMEALIATKKPFQFRQGLDVRLLNDEKAELLARARYHGDMIFAFDNWRDRDVIEKHLKIWKKHCPKKTTKFYLFCGFELTPENDAKLLQDIKEIFWRIRVLMSYGCLGYVMRHEDYKKHELANIYVQIARWCNQPQFYKKMSFWEFCYRNQTFWEETTLKKKSVGLKTYEEFMTDYENGYYSDVKLCLPLKTLLKFLKRFEDSKAELLQLFNLKMADLIDPQLWGGIL